MSKVNPSTNNQVIEPAGLLAEGQVVNTSCTVTSGVFNLPMPTTGTWNIVEVAVGTADQVVATVVCAQAASSASDPTIGASTDGSATWGKGYARLGVIATMTMTRPLTSTDEIRMTATSSAAVVVNLYAN